MSSFIQDQMREEDSQREQVSQMLAQQEPMKFKVGDKVSIKRNGVELVIATAWKSEFNVDFTSYDHYTCKHIATGKTINGTFSNGDLVKGNL